jgi:hypothetical protein
LPKIRRSLLRRDIWNLAIFGENEDIHVFPPVRSFFAGKMGAVETAGHGAGEGESDELLYILL